jgi:broad specificity phosphatase PhoE
MAARVGGVLDHVAAERPGRTVVVACHGGVVVQPMIERLGLAATLPIRASAPPELTSLTNDAVHLAGTPALVS